MLGYFILPILCNFTNSCWIYGVYLPIFFIIPPLPMGGGWGYCQNTEFLFALVGTGIKIGLLLVNDSEEFWLIDRHTRKTRHSEAKTISMILHSYDVFVKLLHMCVYSKVNASCKNACVYFVIIKSRKTISVFMHFYFHIQWYILQHHRHINNINPSGTVTGKFRTMSIPWPVMAASRPPWLYNVKSSYLERRSL